MCERMVEQHESMSVDWDGWLEVELVGGWNWWVGGWENDVDTLRETVGEGKVWRDERLLVLLLWCCWCCGGVCGSGAGLASVSCGCGCMAGQETQLVEGCLDVCRSIAYPSPL